MWLSQDLTCLQSSGHVVTRPPLLLATRVRLQKKRPAQQRTCSCSSVFSPSDAHPQAHERQYSRVSQENKALKQIQRAVTRLSHRWHSRKHKQDSAITDTSTNATISRNPFYRQSTAAAKLCMLFSAAVLPGSGFAELGKNYVFMAGFWGWFFAQGCKIFSKRWRKGVWDLKAIVDSGGMPSSHSALCSAVTTSIALELGLGSPLFAISLAFSLIVMYDAAGVRRHAGKQAEVLNILLEDLLEGHAVSETKLKEVLGHTPIQVCAGALLGFLVGLFFPVPPVMPVA